MRTRPILLAAGILTMSLTLASAQIYDFTTIAGAVTNSGSADGTNSAARFKNPTDVAVDINGNIYVADFNNHTIRKVTPVGTNWVTSTIAGSAGNSGTADGTNGDARFYLPYGVAVDTNGNLYVAEFYNFTIRKIAPVGTNWVTSTIAGLATNWGTADGTNSAARFNNPTYVAVDTNGNVYVADTGNSAIRKVTPVGTNWVTTTIAAGFYGPQGVAVGTNGNVYVADDAGGWAGSTIRKITLVGTNWVTTTIAGSALTSGSADGTNSDAQFNCPYGIAVDANANLYVADECNHNIRKVTPVGTNWVTTTIAGTVTNAGSADGIKSRARFNYPTGVAVDTDGNVYVADMDNHTIRLGVPLSGLTIIKEMAKLNFTKTNSDSCTLTATIDLGAGYDLTNKMVSLDIGGADAWFNLDAKGKGHGVGTNGTYGTCKLSYKKKTGPWTFTAALKKGSWATPWGMYGLTDTPTPKSGVSVTPPVAFFIGDEEFGGEKALLYKAKAGKSGSAK